MIIPDVNLLVYAHNQLDPEHRSARLWWEDCLNGTTPVGIPWAVISGFIRLMTHPRILERPMPVAVATKHARSWLEQTMIVALEPGRGFSNHFFNFLDQLGTAGNLTTDALIAAIAIERQAEVHTCDTDFARFSGLRWLNPLK